MAEKNKNDVDDWQVNKTALECNRYMLENEISTDVSFQVSSYNGDTEVIKAHTYILMSRSPVFYAMFHSDLQKDKENIVVEETEPEAFRVLLEYLYCDSYSVNADNVMSVLYTAKKYIVPKLADHCVEFLQENLLPENVCTIYEQSILYDETALVQRCVTFIETRTPDILSSETFPETLPSTLQRILKFNKLYVSELELFKACCHWAEEVCKRQELEENALNKRKVMGEALYLIRFPTMELKQFANHVAQTGILNAEEKCSVFEYLTCEKKDNIETKFPVTPRQKPQMSVLRRFVMFNKNTFYSSDCTSMQIQVDRPILVKGFGVNGSISYDPLAEVGIMIKQEGNIITNKSFPVKDDRSGGVIPIMMKENLIFSSNTPYTVLVTFHFYGENGQGTCRKGKGGYKAVNNGEINFVFDRADAAGSVPEIYFLRI